MGDQVTPQTVEEASAPRRHYAPSAPDVLVAVFGSLAIGLDGDGLHIAIIDPRTTKAGR